MSIDTKKLIDADELTTFDKANFFAVLDASQDGKVCRLSGENTQAFILGGAAVGGSEGTDITQNNAVQHITNKTLMNCDIVDENGVVVANLDELAADKQKSSTFHNVEIVETDLPWDIDAYLTGIGLDGVVKLRDMRINSCIISADGINYNMMADPNLVKIEAFEGLLTQIVSVGTISSLFLNISFVVSDKGDK